MGVVKPIYIYPLNYVFQEIRNVKTNATYGYEALMRPDNGMDTRTYIDARVAMGGTHQLELDSFFNATKTFSELRIPGYLFINSFPNEAFSAYESLSYIEQFGKEVLSRVVVEIVEYPFLSMENWFNKQRFMLKHDMMCALDAFGEGLNTDVNSVLFYGPDIVKISRAV
ncbi:MAG: EAL domain-containing protein, partial [Lachnospiraceae bacterium]|nr:EAL domain-containing protein [Lachnospiraceae bacterium]